MYIKDKIKTYIYLHTHSGWDMTRLDGINKTHLFALSYYAQGKME